MKKRWAVVAAACLLMGCQKPTGNENFDRIFVRHYDEILQFWNLYARTESIISPWCDDTDLNFKVPDPWVRFGRARRKYAQSLERERLVGEMFNVGMVLPSRTGKIIVDCVAPRKLSDGEMIKEMDERLDKQHQVIEQMEKLSRIVLKKGS